MVQAARIQAVLQRPNDVILPHEAGEVRRTQLPG